MKTEFPIINALNIEPKEVGKVIDLFNAEEVKIVAERLSEICKKVSEVYGVSTSHSPSLRPQ